jgi:hypothetical protein
MTSLTRQNEPRNFPEHLKALLGGFAGSFPLGVDGIIEVPTSNGKALSLLNYPNQEKVATQPRPRSTAPTTTTIATSEHAYGSPYIVQQITTALLK